MEGVVPRHRYTRNSPYYRKRKRHNSDSSSLMEKILKQTFFCICILIIILIIKNINTPATNFISEKVKFVLFQNIELKTVYSNVDDFINNLLNNKTENKDKVSNTNDNSVNTKADNNDELSKTKDNSNELSNTKDNLNVLPKTNDNSMNTKASSYGDLLKVADESMKLNADIKDKTPVGDAKLVNSQNTLPAGKTLEINDVQKNVNISTKDKELINSINQKYKFATPVNGAISSPFGNRMHPLLHRTVFHFGVDIEAKNGDDIKSALGGEVTETGNNATYGNYIIISTGNDLETVYAHCSKILVKKSDKIKQNQVIGRVGDTGLAIGSHLHFEVRINKTVYDPMKFIKVNNS